MTDIVERLHHLAKGGSGPVNEVCATALAEIKRLRHAITSITESHMTERSSAGIGEPVAWRTKNDHGHWHATTNRALAETWRNVEKFVVEPLYVGAAQAARAQEPVAWTNESQLAYLRERDFSQLPMAMWAKPSGAVDVPLYLNAAQCAWLDIETAPKDGTRVLIADENVWMTCARYWPCNSYWIEDAASGLKLNEPTHWMPCPTPPVSSTDGATP